jgi:hypothetical protein
VLGRGSVADPPDDSVLVEAVPEFAQRAVELCDGAEAPQPEQPLLQCADEALEAPVALGWRTKGGLNLDAEDTQIVLEGVGDELGAIVVAKARALRRCRLRSGPWWPRLPLEVSRWPTSGHGDRWRWCGRGAVGRGRQRSAGGRAVRARA